MAAPNRPESESRVENAAQLRARIDRGETGEKVAVSDPAAAPLGTDDEAGGQTSFNLKTSHPLGEGTRPVGPERPQRRQARTSIAFAAVAIILVLAFFYWLLPVLTGS